MLTKSEQNTEEYWYLLYLLGHRAYELRDETRLYSYCQIERERDKRSTRLSLSNIRSLFSDACDLPPIVRH